MMLTAPELVIAQRIELLDQIEVAAELQHRMLADRVMRGEEGSEFEAGHRVSLRTSCSWVLFLGGSAQTTGRRSPRQSRKARRRCMVIVQVNFTYRHPEFLRRFTSAATDGGEQRSRPHWTKTSCCAGSDGAPTTASARKIRLSTAYFGSRSPRSTKKQQSRPTNGRRVRGTCHGAAHRHRRQRPVQHGAGKSRRWRPMPPCTD